MEKIEQPKVSVIIPVYKAEKYIERCARSLFGQTLDSIEYIFIDDCTPDRSMEILWQVLDCYPERKPWVKIVRLSVNSHQAKARTTGMKAATGEYQIHCDPDDWVELNLYEQLYIQAKKSNSDITTCRFKRVYPGHSKIEGYCFSGTAENCLKEFAFDFSLWSKLISTQLIIRHNIFPYEGIDCGEDLNVVFRALYYSKKVSCIPDAGYNYYCNPDSITHNGTINNIETHLLKNLQNLTTFVNDQHKYWLNETLNKIKFSLKAPLIWTNPDFNYREAKYWCNLWPECHSAIKDLFPSMKGTILNMLSSAPVFIYLYHKYLVTRQKGKTCSQITNL